MQTSESSPSSGEISEENKNAVDRTVDRVFEGARSRLLRWLKVQGTAVALLAGISKENGRRMGKENGVKA